MPRLATVIETSGASAKISVALRGACEHCSGQGACSLTGPPPGASTSVLTARNPIGAQAGDTVEYDLPPRGELKLSLLVWAVPLCGIVVGAVAGALIAGPLGIGQDAPTLVGATLGFAATYLWLRRFDRRSAEDPALSPFIIRVVNGATCEREQPQVF